MDNLLKELGIEIDSCSHYRLIQVNQKTKQRFSFIDKLKSGSFVMLVVNVDMEHIMNLIVKKPTLLFTLFKLCGDPLDLNFKDFNNIVDDMQLTQDDLQETTCETIIVYLLLQTIMVNLKSFDEVQFIKFMHKYFGKKSAYIAAHPVPKPSPEVLKDLKQSS